MTLIQGDLFVQRYNLNYHTVSGDLIPGHTIAMSSYAGMLFSLDDFYSLSSGLASLETTLFVYNTSLFDLVTPVGTMWEPVRVMTANRLATSGREWTEIFRCKEKEGEEKCYCLIVSVDIMMVPTTTTGWWWTLIRKIQISNDFNSDSNEYLSLIY